MNYGEVQSAVQSYVRRDDPLTLGNVANAIAFGQNWIAQNFSPVEGNKLGLLPFVTATEGPWAAAPLPARFGRFVAISQQGLGALTYMDPRTFADVVASGPFSGLYTIANGEVLASGSLAGLSLVTNYIEQPGPLANSGDTNYLTLAYPDLLVWAAVAEQQRFLQDAPEADTAQANAERLLAWYTKATQAKQQSGGRLTIRS